MAALYHLAAHGGLRGNLTDPAVADLELGDTCTSTSTREDKIALYQGVKRYTLGAEYCSLHRPQSSQTVNKVAQEEETVYMGYRT